MIRTSETLRDHLGYFRNLIRVTRATALVTLMYVLVFALRPAWLLPDVASFARGSVALVLLMTAAATTVFAWARLESGYVAAVTDAASSIAKATNSADAKGESDDTAATRA